jgi:predicted deacylase
MYKPLINKLDATATRLEDKGLSKLAVVLDTISNTLEKIASNPSPKALRKEFDLSEGDLDKAYLKRIKKIALKKGFDVKSIGDIDDTELIMLQPQNKVKGPNLLIISGIHGDEPAGPFGILRYIEKINKEILKKVNLTFIPLMNPTGFRKNNRDNKWDEKTNRNYEKDKKISREGKILKDNVKMYLDNGKDGVLSLHEDVDSKYCYIYMYNKAKSKDLGNILLNVDRMFFEQMTPAKSDKKDGQLEKGIIWDRHEGSFEDWLNEQVIKEIATTETPGAVDFDDRIQANVMIINAFVNYHLS